MSSSEERLQKVIAKSGYTSRRKAEKLIEEGKVKVNSEVVNALGTKVTPEDRIEVEGVPLEKEAPVYYMLYKPRGVISSVKDEKGRKVVTELLPEIRERIFPVGRLDYDTSGLLILTNDGDFANLLMHPSHGIEKVYIAKTKGIPDKDSLKKLRKGINVDGEKLKAASVKILSTDNNKKTAIVQIILHEGKNRQIRRMFESLNLPIDKLKREQYAFLTLEGMSPGDSRELNPHEVKKLKMLAEKNVKQ